LLLCLLMDSNHRSKQKLKSLIMKYLRDDDIHTASFVIGSRSKSGAKEPNPSKLKATSEIPLFSSPRRPPNLAPVDLFASLLFSPLPLQYCACKLKLGIWRSQGLLKWHGTRQLAWESNLGLLRRVTLECWPADLIPTFVLQDKLSRHGFFTFTTQLYLPTVPSPLFGASEPGYANISFIKF
jgi:hypothetical protein